MAKINASLTGLRNVLPKRAIFRLLFSAGVLLAGAFSLHLVLKAGVGSRRVNFSEKFHSMEDNVRKAVEAHGVARRDGDGRRNRQDGIDPVTHQDISADMRTHTKHVAATTKKPNPPSVGGKGSKEVINAPLVSNRSEQSQTLHAIQATKQSPFAPGPTGCKTMKQMIVLHWDPHWSWHRNPNGLKEFLDCDKKARKRLCITWFTTSDRAYSSKADIIITHDWSGYPALPERAFPNQLFMYMTMESPYSGYSSQGLQHLFNLAYKYPLDSHVRAAYIPIGENSFKEIHGAPHFSFKEKFADPISSLVSNCGGFVPRVSFMEQLNPLVPVHSFGACFHNHDLPTRSDVSTLEKYKVAMVFENSLCYDYVTEKWWRALTQATIPLVTSNKGIPDYRKFAPTLHSYINYADFKDINDLATHLKKVMGDEELYNKYMEHRFLPEEKLNPLYREHFSNSTCDDFCRLADKMTDTVEMEKLARHRNEKDTSCRLHGILK